MTAMVVLDADLDLDGPVTVGVEDIDTMKGTRSRLQLGVTLPRREMLRLALMASENRAASAVARHYPGGVPAFVTAMNAKAAALGMSNTRFVEPTGLSSDNVSSAHDLALMVKSSSQYPLIREYTTQPSHFVEVQPTGRVLGFNNSNPLVANEGWDIKVSKTGFIREAGKCLVLLAHIASKPVVIVLLDSLGRHTRIADAVRVKHWLETGEGLPLASERKVKVRSRSLSVARALKAKPSQRARAKAARR
jgi:D-alanyl-D-alanine endopeptidase (penicillin-binding protein 7)